MRLHIAHNEKIIERCINNFEAVYPGGNKWIVFNNASENDYVLEHNYVIKCDPDSKLFWESVGDALQYEKIIIHYLSIDSAKFVSQISHPSIYWIEWGGDLYNGLLNQRGFQLYFDKNIEWKIFGHQMPRTLYWMYKKWKSYRYNHYYYLAIRQIKYFVPDSMYDEYPLFLYYYPEFSHLQYRDFFYYPIDEILGWNFEKIYCTGSNIIIGNSASLTGNHIEAFNIISTLNLNNRSIIAPLSYGPSKYVDYVCDKGKELFGDSFVPVLEFMPIEQYNLLLCNARIFIYNNYRQEAVGNIIIALYLGGKVFLNKRNPLLSFYKSLGIIIFDLDTLTLPEGLTPISRSEVVSNREILHKTYSRNRLLSLIRTNM